MKKVFNIILLLALVFSCINYVSPNTVSAAATKAKTGTYKKAFGDENHGSMRCVKIQKITNKKIKFKMAYFNSDGAEWFTKTINAKIKGKKVKFSFLDDNPNYYRGSGARYYTGTGVMELHKKYITIKTKSNGYNDTNGKKFKLKWKNGNISLKSW